jgi:flagellar biosynthesis GTPase FlhF
MIINIFNKYMKNTRFMSKLFSDVDYQEKIIAKIDEAHENGSASLEEDGENLQFADVEGDIIVEDKTDGMSEVTRISPNPDDDNDFIVTAVDVPAEETPAENPEEKTVVASDNLSSIEISRIPGPDGDKADDIIDDLEIEVKTGVEDEEKSGTNTYSLKFKNYSKKRAQMFAKLFSECAECFDKVVESANVDEDVQVKFEDGKMKVMSVTFGKPVRTFSEGEGDGGDNPDNPENPENPDDEPDTDLTDIIDSANKLTELADAGITKENADEIKTLAEEILNKAEAAESDEVSLSCVKRMCSKFSEEAAAVADAAEEQVNLDEEQKTESDTTFEEIDTDEDGKISKEEWVAAEKSEEDFDKMDTDGDGIISKEEFDAFIAETKTESNANPQVMQCEETGKWYIVEDPEKKLYDTQEEANEVAAREFSKQFSEPKVTVTIEDLEPASVGDLLGYSEKKEEPKDDELTPAVNPNEGGTGRQFSMTAPKSCINPLLHTEIN